MIKKLIVTLLTICMVTSTASALSWADAREMCGLRQGFNKQNTDVDDICGMVLEAEGVLPWTFFYTPNYDAVEICRMTGIITEDENINRLATEKDVQRMLNIIKNNQYTIPQPPVTVVFDDNYLISPLEQCRYILTLKKIPKCILNAYKSTIYVGDKRTEAYSKIYGARVAGLFYDFDNHICVEAPEYLTHEIGHFWDAYLHYPSSHYYLYKTESKALSELKGDYCTVDRYEYFAEAFDEFINNTELLKECCPNTYNCIKQEIEERS